VPSQRQRQKVGQWSMEKYGKTRRLILATGLLPTFNPNLTVFQFGFQVSLWLFFASMEFLNLVDRKLLKPTMLQV
jgi:hypothetical protein